jgi:glutaredoxin 3
MTEVVVYSSMFCPFCFGAKRLLQKKGVDFTEINVDGDREARREMIERAEGRYTVPQVFIDGQPVGGYDELSELDMDGALDALLGIA